MRIPLVLTAAVCAMAFAAPTAGATVIPPGGPASVENVKLPGDELGLTRHYQPVMSSCPGWTFAVSCPTST
jgi:hypothetical protein